ncbi:uncharacterized protein MJAP1_001876 [Malassezia japonica]|uniref:Uncharacterized protein n=1 Tax=Malassezia japonica TaxID=223818 RepID=A0AAF0JA53_9BASI|nr:uncharacterized protein MJAP1_001876 [Malassezia japonica]WFD38910.1 hypothetical protein MJAP1_001876 [Malassezia japonica]
MSARCVKLYTSALATGAPTTEAGLLADLVYTSALPFVSSGDEVPPLEAVRAAAGDVLAADDRTQVLVKLFFLGAPASDGAAYNAQYVTDALERVRALTEVAHVDMLVLAFPALADQLDARAQVPDEATAAALRRLWNAAGALGVRVGIADLALPALQAVFSSVAPDVRGVADDRAVYAYPALVSAGAHHRECAPDAELYQWCAAHDAPFVVHHDAQPMLAADELDELAPQLAPPARRLEPEWVARYTVLVPDRGIVAKQG